MRRRKISAPFMHAPAPFGVAGGTYATLQRVEYEWPRVVLALVLAEYHDYLVCNCYTADQLAVANPDQFMAHPPPFDGRSFAVAKPYLLMRSPFDGQQVTYPGFESLGNEGEITVSYTYLDIGLRTASDVDGNEDDERQRITPDYFVNDIISIARVRAAGGDWAGIVRDDPLDEDANGQPIEWTDMNSAGRAWAVWEE